jgi:hypothetical protein
MAVFKQERHVELVPNTAEAFVITNIMFSATIPVQLPHLNIFVISVADPLDPKQDALARVANIADLSLVPIGRDAGIAAPGTSGIEFLSQTSTLRYDTLETANDAATAFQNRVNALIEGWITFRTEFNAPDPTPASYTFPTTDPSQKTALINAYTVAKQARYQAQVDKGDADDALARAQTDYTYKSGLIAGVTTILGDATRVQTDLNVVITNFTSLKVASNTFYAANPGGVGAAAFLVAITLAINELTASTGYQADAATAVTDATTYQSARQADAATASTALTAAQADQIAKAQALISIQATETAALAAVLAVCPDFDKHSIPFVPDTEP